MEITDEGRAVIRNRCRTLSVRERQILLMLTGSDTGRRMLQGMGEEITPVIRKLQHLGLVRQDHAHRLVSSPGIPGETAAGQDPFSDSAFDRISRKARQWLQPPAAPSDAPVATPRTAVQGKPAPVVARPEAAPAPAGQAAPAAASPRPTPAARGKRSLAATKMYMIDMLQLLRTMDASALAVDIQTSDSEQELVTHVLRGAAYFAQATNASYAAKVYGKLEEVLPQEWLPQLRELQALHAAP